MAAILTSAAKQKNNQDIKWDIFLKTMCLNWRHHLTCESSHHFPKYHKIDFNKIRQRLRKHRLKWNGYKLDFDIPFSSLDHTNCVPLVYVFQLSGGCVEFPATSRRLAAALVTFCCEAVAFIVVLCIHRFLRKNYIKPVSHFKKFHLGNSLRRWSLLRVKNSLRMA